MNCPHCGKPLSIVKAGATAPAGYTVNRRQVFHAAAPWGQSSAPAYEGYDYEKRQPAREPNLQADVAVPAAQSVLTGLAVGVPGAAVLGLLGYELGQCLTAGAVAMVAGISVTWFVKLGLHHDLLWAIETVTGRDIDGDNQTGAPVKPEPEPVRIELAEGRKTRLVDLPATDAQLTAIAQTVLSGGAFSRRGLAEIVNETEYKSLAAAMLAGGLLASRGAGANAGVELTSAGRAVLKKVVVAGGGAVVGPESTTKHAVGEGAL